MAWPKWRHTLNESKRLAIKAVDEYNSSTGHYADFIGTMVRAWLYLLQAEFQREKVDHRHRGNDDELVLINGEAKLWEVGQCVKHRLPDPMTRSASIWNFSSSYATRSSIGMSRP